MQRQRPFEPHSYRDLARSLEESGKYALAALQYEIVLAGTWHNRFRDSLKEVAQEEYARMMREAVRDKAAQPASWPTTSATAWKVLDPSASRATCA